MKIFQPIISGSFTTSGSVFLKGLTPAAQSNVVLIDTSSGQLYTTASSALGGGGSGTGFPFTGTAQITGSLIVTTNVQIDGSLIDFSKVNSSIVGNNNLYQIATGSYTAAFTKYTVSNGANARAGEFVTVWNGTTTEFTDVSTKDVGNTTDVTLSSAIVTSQIKIDVITATSGWNIKSTTTFI
jgi:hypothetical protein